MSVESLKNQNENLTQKDLLSLKKTLEQKNKPGVVNYLRESKDGKYNIYSYILAQGGTKGGIKNKYINQIGQWIEGTQFTDANGNEIKKDKFNAGEIVYLRVPKQETKKGTTQERKTTQEIKETRNTPGKVEYIGNKKDNKNRNWKYYSYTFLQGGTTSGVWDKRYSSEFYRDDLYNVEFCDENGNKLKKEWFGKGETIYIRTPNIDIIDPTPEMSIDEIMNIPDKDLHKLGSKLRELGTKSFVTHYDKIGEYLIINGKKVYVLENYMQRNKKLDYILESKPFFIFRGDHGSPENPAIIKKVGKVYRGVEADPINHIYRGDWEKNQESYNFYHKN